MFPALGKEDKGVEVTCFFNNNNNDDDTDDTTTNNNTTNNTTTCFLRGVNQKAGDITTGM